MGDLEAHLGATILRAIREAHPANIDRPRWVRLDAEAKRRGFPSTRALRAWCSAHRVVVRDGSNRDAWVCPEDIDRAVEQLPLATRSPPATESSADAELRARGLLC